MKFFLGCVYWLRPFLQSFGQFHLRQQIPFHHLKGISHLSTPYFIVNITSSFLKCTSPFDHILPTYNIFTINRNKLTMNFAYQNQSEHETHNWWELELIQPFWTQLQAQWYHYSGLVIVPCHKNTRHCSATNHEKIFFLAFLLVLYLVLTWNLYYKFVVTFVFAQILVMYMSIIYKVTSHSHIKVKSMLK